MKWQKIVAWFISLIFLVLWQFINQVHAEVFHCGNPNSGKVALTFDDGPSPETTPQILEILKAYGARATFFLVDENILKYPEITREILRNGHEIGNHTFSHANLKHLNPHFESIFSQIELTQKIIFQLTGFLPKIFRPPYSSITSLINGFVTGLGLKVILWTISPADWKNPSPEVIVKRVLSGVKAGDIIVLHDFHPNTVYALPLILQGLKERELRSVTVSNILKTLIVKNNPRPFYGRFLILISANINDKKSRSEDRSLLYK